MALAVIVRRLDLTYVCVCFLYVLWTYQRYSEENYNSIWLNGHWMRGNRESKMNIIFIYHLNIHILFLNLTFTCNERRRFSRVTIRPPLLYWPREKNGPEWYGLDNVVNLLVWSHFHSTKPLSEISLQFTVFLFEFSYSLICPSRLLGIHEELSEVMFVDL